MSAQKAIKRKSEEPLSRPSKKAKTEEVQEDEHEEEVELLEEEESQEQEANNWKLSDKPIRRVNVSEFRKALLVNIREYYIKDGEEKPGSKGISLTLAQWENLKKSMPAIDKEIKRQNKK